MALYIAAYPVTIPGSIEVLKLSLIISGIGVFIMPAHTVCLCHKSKSEVAFWHVFLHQPCNPLNLLC